MSLFRAMEMTNLGRIIRKPDLSQQSVRFLKEILEHLQNQTNKLVTPQEKSTRRDQKE